MSTNKLPVIPIPVTKTERLLNALTLGLLLAATVYLVLSLSDLPDRVPIHYNGAGEADGWGPKSTLFMLPAFGLLIYVGLGLLRKIPHHFNYPVEITPDNAERKYRVSIGMMNAMKYEITLLFAYLLWASVRNAQGIAAGIGAWFLPVFIAAIIGTLIYGLVRLIRG